jgi:integrase
MLRKRLTDWGLKGKELEPRSKVYEVMDTEVRGFGVRVLTSGRLTFILFRRWPGGKHPARRSLGSYPELSLADAREMAREWNLLAGRGIDPVKRKPASTFKDAFEDYLKRKASKLKSGPDIEREMRRELAGWMDKPIADITEDDVKEVIKNIATERKVKARGIERKGAPTAAHFLFAVTRAFFTWAIDTRDYGLEASPFEKLKPTVLIGPRNARKRVLKDYELVAFWHATFSLGYPWGPFYRILALTGLRRDEAADARRREIEGDIWIVPAERMKNGLPHTVPMTEGIKALVDALPLWNAGDFLFSGTGGEKGVSGFSKAKARLDAAMAAELKKGGHEFKPFVIQDVRRTVRTRLSALPIEQHVRELIVSHKQSGVKAVYDIHEYDNEKREGLELWEKRLLSIVQISK